MTGTSFADTGARKPRNASTASSSRASSPAGGGASAIRSTFFQRASIALAGSSGILTHGYIHTPKATPEIKSTTPKTARPQRRIAKTFDRFELSFMPRRRWCNDARGGESETSVEGRGFASSREVHHTASFLRLSSHSLVLGALSLASLLWSARARAESLELRLVSYNVYMVPITAPARAERLEQLPSKLAELKPDVVMLQEVWSEADSASLERSLRAQGLVHVYRAASSAPFSYDSSGMLIASRFVMTSAKRHSFSVGRFPHTPYHLDWIGRKGALDVSIETPLGPVRFVDTHFQASYVTGSYESVRISQSLELASWLQDATQPLVLGGDFNARSDWPSCRVLREESRARLPEGRWRVDQVLLRDGNSLSVDSVEMKRVLQEPVLLSDGSKRRLSDHRAVVMRLRLSNKPEGPAPAATKRTFDPELREQATAVLNENLRRTGRQNIAGYAALVLCLVFGLWGSRRVRRARQQQARGLGWSLLTVGSVLTGVWAVYFLLGYVPHRRAGIERALVTLAQDAR